MPVVEKDWFIRTTIKGDSATVEWLNGHTYGDSFQLSNGKREAAKGLGVTYNKVKLVGVSLQGTTVLALHFKVK